MIKFFEREGVHLRYLEQGQGDPVVFVHGSNVDHRIWEPHRARYARNYRFIALTQRYFGTDSWPDNGSKFSLQVHADDLAVLLGAVSELPVSVVGWSYGGAVALATAVQHPHLIRKLFLYEPALATFINDPVDAKTAADDRTDMLREAFKTVSDGNLVAAVRVFMDSVNNQKGAFDGLLSTIQNLMIENGRMLPLLFAAPPPPSVTCADLADLQFPVAVVMGKDSRAFYQICSKWASRCIPGARLTSVPNARHLWPIQNPLAFADTVLDFLGAS
jgi:pimeloyl-ACP methyl ester carboxylesterase